MKRKRYLVEQIVAAVKQHELGMSAADISRKLGIAERTFYRWKKKFTGLWVNIFTIAWVNILTTTWVKVLVIYTYSNN